MHASNILTTATRPSRPKTSLLHALTGIAAVLIGLQARADVAFDLTTATIPEIQKTMDDGILTSEKLISMYLNRIAHYEKTGPNLHSIITVNGRALFEARALDKERATNGPRSPLHGIPVIVKDNLNTEGVRTSGGAWALRHVDPPRDAFVISQLRKAGAIILAKSNLSEFASGSPGLTGASSLGGQPRNPYNLSRHADGSSSGSGSGLAAVFAQVGLGTETGSSNRGPSAHNNLAGLTPTEGMMSRDGCIPLSFTLDRIGIMARSVTDLAHMFNYVIGVDFNDQVTRASIGRTPDKPYQTFLNKDGLKGARIGVFREVFTSDAPRSQEAIALTDAAIVQLRDAGAMVIDPVFSGYTNIMARLALQHITPNELRSGIDSHLFNLGDSSPVNSLEELLGSGGILYSKFTSYAVALKAPPVIDHPGYIADIATRTEIREMLTKLMDDLRLDAFVYLHNLNPPQYVNEPHTYTKVRLSSVSGMPGMIVPGGFTSENLPVGIEFLARSFDEPTLFRIGSAYEHVSRHRKLPESTPKLPTDVILK